MPDYTILFLQFLELYKNSQTHKYITTTNNIKLTKKQKKMKKVNNRSNQNKNK